MYEQCFTLLSWGGGRRGSPKTVKPPKDFRKTVKPPKNSAKTVTLPTTASLSFL